MNAQTLESFMTFCDEYQIVEEGMVNSIANFIESTFKKIKHTLKRLMYNFYKIKKYYIPEKISEYIQLICKKCDDSYHTIIAYSVQELTDDKAQYDQIIKNITNMPEYVKLSLGNATFDKKIEVPSNKIINELKAFDKMVEIEETNYMKDKRGDKKYSDLYWTSLIKLFNIRISVLMKYFTYGKTTSDNNASTIDLGTTINATIIMDTI